MKVFFGLKSGIKTDFCFDVFVLWDYIFIFACISGRYSRIIYFLSSPPEFDTVQDEQDVRESACKARACFRLLKSGRILGGAVRVRVFLRFD